MNGLSTVFILLGLFLVGGVVSFVKQGVARGVIVLLAVSAAMALTAGVLRLEVWN
ncbi:hypothetical protein RKE29_19445 [Streptomyces sp. B1866]|uniref:hypothetical protein n=1 Tax=Streptomyces sp. B1866 TaxID=3075431 RepID=UPI00288C706E|nr:hypothetical protein [Streptomyces sp. B1866]MDT3398794.1 hypothetical protein [Streptomyces sp. B1866]